MARILVIDDDSGVRTLLSEVFSGMEQKHSVVEAPDGVKGLALAKLDPPDVIVVDVDMPGLNGYEVCLCLRAFPATRKVPILMLTGTTNLPGAMSGLASGADDHITKPFNVDEVAARVQSLLLRRKTG
jgi:DNA-binding response OmpR family regulator